ncbi:MAG: hypothetical protein LPK26_11740 [Bacillaceae bacterium]|uniref:EfeO-type cupredoxin-like domain-containing protein n=1 Tax=Alkalihalobacterium chitinilyticum TaxID=2980103 RepID=A0ABT5VIZ6_9BACI|nr:hypothetical protein [Alkalihalobacterium chitinilyticum]MDE5415429.1 hypothetical protein [Alkalihalobacterium chitinilyticum]MEB1807940.1 hypothetical protein [Bacillaceae bacterium]
MLIIIKKKWFFLAIAVLFIGFSWYIFNSRAVTEAGSQTVAEKFEIHMVTSEIKSKTDDGKVIESYRWDPGTIYVPKDKKVSLTIYGVNGKEHPFIIEGTDVKGTVKKGEETVLDLHFTEEGIYRLICTAHANKDHNGPMIAYIIVD